MFEVINNDTVKSSEGYQVEVKMRTYELYIKYTEGSLVATMGAEGMTLKNGATVFGVGLESFDFGDPYVDRRKKTSEKKIEIIKRIDEALGFMKIPHLFD